ncbi:hypothetical protein FF38_07734 [Lucilia cuprina]|uniref:Chitin-binding type-2 domain-containing protein n=1 Tax=Lucilia cuprina TaxID=7375 RepID=A0A0L0BN61_LUCCU|nr:hypothetical protein FF38_07734 [Lucilia cuprina]
MKNLIFLSVLLFAVGIGADIIEDNPCKLPGFFAIKDNSPVFYGCYANKYGGLTLKYLSCQKGEVFSSLKGYCVPTATLNEINDESEVTNAPDVEDPTIPTESTVGDVENPTVPTEATPVPEEVENPTIPTEATTVPGEVENPTIPTETTLAPAPETEPTKAPETDPTKAPETEAPATEPTKAPETEPTKAPENEPTKAPETEATATEPTKAPEAETTKPPVTEPPQSPEKVAPQIAKTDEFVCLSEGTYAHANDCAKYYKCKWNKTTENFVVEIKQCAEKQVYNTFTDRCDREGIITCLGRPKNSRFNRL